MAAQDNDPIRAARALYARQMAALLGQPNQRLQAAFAAVPREAFLDDKPWRIVSPGGATVSLPQNDPTLIYQDVLLALQPERGVNNGSPSLHIRLLHALDVRPGQRVLHLGAGAGYYTAILAELAGPQGSVTGVELDPDLAALAERNLKPWKQARIVCGDGFHWPRAPTDRIYVNFALARPADAWLSHLPLGGRLLFPLAVPAPAPRSGVRHAMRGGALLVENRGPGFAASHVAPAYFVWAAGQRPEDAAMLAKLTEAFDRGGIEFVRSLVWKGAGDPGRCWFWQPDWALCYDKVPD
ncbi:MAG: protein-L-isoaspartate O-methyltransferase [Reyranellaceae bacterium]